MAEPPLFSSKIDDPLPTTPGAARPATFDVPLKYADVPWYRREPGALVMLLALLFAPVTIALCVIALTGNVYKNAYDEKGNLHVWGIGNKVAAVLLLAIQGLVTWRALQP